ncbi:MAG: DUF1232 domain-containing protein [Trueperaceae bacterium]|nr:DUF1232 domain-containing protein [Trueperaceae bacterium]
MAISDQQIEKVLNSDAMQATVDNPSTLERIKAEFEKSFAMVKDKLGDAWEDVRAIYDMTMDKEFQVKKEVKYVSIGALAYLISPIDLLPERVLGPLGLADDVAVLLWALNYAKPEIQRYAEFKAGNPTAVAADENDLADASQTGTDEA